MKYAAIDVGSNSVRVLSDGRKLLEITTLGEGLLLTGRLKPEAIKRTADAVKKFYDLAVSEGADKVFVFATEAVRAAENGGDFITLMKENGIDVDLVSKDKEAEYGFLGAYTGGTCAILDIGGASAEIAVGDENGIVYKKSLPLGAVRLKDYSDEVSEMEEYVKTVAANYLPIPRFDRLVAIGGTPTTYAAIKLESEPYDPVAVNGTTLTLEEIRDITERIVATPYEDRKNIKGLHPKKVPFAVQSGVLLYTIAETVGAGTLTVSESDNLEGYIKAHS